MESEKTSSSKDPALKAARRKMWLFNFYTAFVLSVAAFLFVFIAFATPYWYKSWSRVHSPLANVGLWHICLSGWVKPYDPSMRAYVGCWWIHSTFFEDVYDEIMPPWFKAVQALVIFTVLCNLAAMVIHIVYIVRLKQNSILIKFDKKRKTLFFVCCILLCASGGLVLIVSLVFAEKAKDGSWMPRPWLNYLSFSYGCNVMCGFASAFAGMFTFIIATRKPETEPDKAHGGFQMEEKIAPREPNAPSYLPPPQQSVYPVPARLPQPGYYPGPPRSNVSRDYPPSVSSSGSVFPPPPALAQPMSKGGSEKSESFV